MRERVMIERVRKTKVIKEDREKSLLPLCQLDNHFSPGQIMIDFL